MGSLPPKQPHPYPFLEQWKNFWASLERPPPLFFNGIPPSLCSSYLKPPSPPLLCLRILAGEIPPDRRRGRAAVVLFLGVLRHCAQALFGKDPPWDTAVRRRTQGTILQAKRDRSQRGRPWSKAQNPPLPFCHPKKREKYFSEPWRGREASSSFPCTGMELLLLREKERSSHLSPFLFFPPSPSGIWEERRKEEGVMARLPFLPSLQFGKTSPPLSPPVPKKMCSAMEGGEREKKAPLGSLGIRPPFMFRKPGSQKLLTALFPSVDLSVFLALAKCSSSSSSSCFPGCLSSYVAGCRNVIRQFNE